MRFFFSAGEASGEAYGAQLITTLRQGLPDGEFFGLGGDAMRAAGCDTVVNAADIAVVGLAEVVRHLPYIYRQYKTLLRAVDARRPDAAILIDFPDFNFRLARQLHRRGIPVFYYISPQMWAWRPGRIELVRRYVRQMLVIFPFEQEWYRERGVDAIYVGHPLADLPAPTISREAFGRQCGLDPEKWWIALLPGSRRREVSMNLPAMLEAARQLGPGYQFLLPVAPTLDRSWVEGLTRDSGLPVIFTGDARGTLHHARAGIVASGTATVEAALLGLPFVMVYRVAPLTFAIGRPLVKVPFYGMVNLIAGRLVVPELIQHEFRAERVTSALAAIIADGPAREQMLADLASVRHALQGPISTGLQGRSATERVAKVILNKVSKFQSFKVGPPPASISR
jgi:lipid-A-disaccharide synthase